MKLLQQYLRDARFLIIDEDFANVRLLESHLENSGRTNVRSTTDTRSAFSLFTEFQPDLVLLGLTTQNLDGLALMAHIRGALPPDSYLPIIALTETGGPAKRMAALEAGARDFLHMPVDADELDLRICNLLEARFLHLGLQQEKRALETRMGERTHELEHAMRELRESQQQVIHQQRLTAFSEMAGGVVHDFNNNLMVLLGYIEMLLEPANIENPPILREGLSVMRHAAKDAAQVVQRLRQFYRPRADDEHYTSVRVADLARQAFELAQPKWRSQALSAGTEIRVRVEAPDDLYVHGNAAELREVFLNLIFNSVDAMPAGGEITISARPRGARVLIGVRDAGLGMTEDVRHRCFEPFFTTKGEQGTGLGLSMVFGIIRRHDGTIAIASERGRGTTFTISLPREAEMGASPLRKPLRPAHPLRVLFADDDPRVCKLIAHFLEPDGHTVTIAGDGREALELFHSGKFDVVVTDLSMPKLDGERLADAVKREASGQPVIMLTGFGDMFLSGSGKPASIDLLLSKPVSAETLVDALARVTKTHVQNN